MEQAAPLYESWQCLWVCGGKERQQGEPLGLWVSLVQTTMAPAVLAGDLAALGKALAFS